MASPDIVNREKGSSHPLKPGKFYNGTVTYVDASGRVTVNVKSLGKSEERRQLEQQAAQPSLTHCEECGEEIPKKRQELVKGVKLCVYCQQMHERR
jgi:phage/conjugal plasmid C-4 type zinc finger TraR family protein